MTALLALVSPIWGRLAPYLVAAGLGVVLVAGIYETGVRAERKRGEAAGLRAQIATLEADIKQARLAAADGAARATAIEAASATDNRIIEEVRRAAGPNSCRLSPADAARLQSIGSGRAGARP